MVFLMALGLIAIKPLSSYAQDAWTDNSTAGNMKDEAKEEVAISGFCPVCVFSGVKSKGNDHFITEYKDKIYKFADMDKQKEFLEDPEKYTADLDAKFQQIK